jgi:hypothetical protein
LLDLINFPFEYEVFGPALDFGFLGRGRRRGRIARRLGSFLGLLLGRQPLC